MNARDKDIISTLLKIARICGTFPTEKPSRRFYIYQCLVFIGNLFYTAIGIYNDFSGNYKSYTVLAFIGATTSAVVAMQGFPFQLMSLCFPELWREFYAHLQMNSDKCPTKNRNVYIEIFALCTIVLTRIFLNFWIWTPVIGFQSVINYFFRHLNDCFTMVSIMILVHINIVLKRRYTLINAYLKQSNCIQHVQKLYFKTTQLIESSNNIFGYHILIITANTIFVLLQNLHIVLWYFDYNQENGVKIMCWYAFYTTIVIIQITAFILSCDRVIKEAENVVKTCCEIQDNLDLYRRENVFEFLAMVRARPPRYTAAGYFVVNNGTLLALFSTVTTYFIIVVQFHQMNY